jgi:hypothetical protein
MTPPHKQRTTVRVTPAAETPISWQSTLRLMSQLIELFPDSIIDVKEVCSDDSPGDPELRRRLMAP